jgi:uncharacterized protein YdeI (YjbR/CyaY-like superfamily)
MPTTAEFTPTSVRAWRTWLAEHGGTEPSVMLVIRRKSNPNPGITGEEAIETALCFGWVDSKASPRDTSSFLLRFSPRSPKSRWGKKNRERAARMIERGLMVPAGQEMIDHARSHDLWNPHADAENGIILADLAAEFAGRPEALRHFQAFAPSARRELLVWISTAVKPETRARRIQVTVAKAAENERAR